MQAPAPDLGLQRRIRSEQVHVDADNRWRMTRLDPDPSLAQWVQGYCDYSEHTSNFSSRRELPHAEGVLIINLADPIQITGGDGQLLGLRAGTGFMAGVHLRPALSHSTGQQAGVQVQLPLSTLHQMCGVPMQALLDQVVALDDVLPATLRRSLQQMVELPDLAARIAVLEHGLHGLLGDAVLDVRDRAALHLLRAQPQLDICRVADQVGLSRKQLAQRITRIIGVGPRSYRRLLRFQQVTGRLHSAAGQAVDWTDLALDCGYFDQSHLIREFREFAGLTPAQCLARTLIDGGGVVEA